MHRSPIFGGCILLAVLATCFAATLAAADGGIAPATPDVGQPVREITLSSKFLELQGRDERDYGIDFGAAKPAGTSGVLMVRGSLSIGTLHDLISQGRAQLLNEPRITLDDGVAGEVDFATKLGYHAVDQEAAVTTYITVQGTLKVTIHVIGEDNATGQENIKLTLDLTVPDGIGYVGGGGLPAQGVMTFREVKAEVTLHDGQTLVIAGLPRQEPPTPDGSSLVVFLTPQIVRELPRD